MSKEHINLPKTKFSMKANLPNKEPNYIEFWKKIDLYNLLRQKSKGQEKFVLHDGPPYANGNIHMFQRALFGALQYTHQLIIKLIEGK